MTPERYQQIEKIYNAALDLKPDELTPFLEEACAGDDNLLLEVRRLLDANEKVTDFLNNPAVEEAKKIEDSSFIGRQIGRYQLTSEIGSGGMGKVYLARDAKLGRKVAIKILPPESTSQPDMVVRFEQEAIAASSLNHPNIITIHEIGESDGIYFITTEFIEGVTLRKRLEAGKLPIAEAADITLQIAKALEAAHSAGIIHRDIKPENAMIRPDGLVKVLDFGLAKLSATSSPGLIGDSEGLSLKQAKTTPGTILGTVSYMSPEQARGKDLDGRTDIWSLGVVFFEMLTGKKPFKGDTATDVLISVIQKQPPPIESLLPGTPSELKAILVRSLAKDKAARYQSAGEMVADLKSFLETFLAKSESSWPPTKRLDSDSQAGEMSQYRTSISRYEIPEPVEKVSPETNMDRARDTAARSSTVPQKKEKPRMIPILIGAALVIVLAIIAVTWNLLRNKLPDKTASSVNSVQGLERSLKFFLTIQKMRDGQPFREPFESSGQDVFGDGWKFKLNFTSPHAGYLYVLNEGPISDGAISYNLLFPYKSSSQLAAGVSVETGWYQLTDHPGTEKLWLIFSSRSLDELETVKNVEVKEPSQLDFIRRLIDQGSRTVPDVKTDKVSERTTLTARGDSLIYALELKHR